MFREPWASDPEKARRAFLLLVPSTLAIIPLGAWCVILRDWLLLAICVVFWADLVALEMKFYAIGWRGSRVDSYARFPRISQAQYILFGLVFIVGTLGVQLALDQGRKELILVLIAVVSAVWLFRFVRAMRKEGWRGNKSGSGQRSG